MSFTVLLIDDSPDDRALVARELRRHFGDIGIMQAGTAEAMAEAIDNSLFDVTITDYRLRFTDGISVLRELKRRFPERPVIMFTASGNEEVAVEAMKEGLDDYITKTAKHYPRIGYAVRSCLERLEQRSQVEQALARESLAKARLEIALQSAHMATWQVALDTNAASYSDAMGPMFGRPAGFTHANLQAWLDDMHPDDHAAVLAEWNAALGGKRFYQVRFRAVGADGVTRWIESSGKVLHDAAGAPVTIIGTARDISADVRIQQNLERQREELEKADRQKNNFLSILAHELRNPLAAAGYSVALLRQAGGNMATVARATDVIDRQISHMAKLLKELLDLSRITHDRVELERERLDLSQVVEMGCDSARPALQEKGQQLGLSLPAGPVIVEGDEVRLTQVLSNLLNNAAKFTPAGGRIGVRIAQEGGLAVVEVSDNGIGIEAHRLEDVFDMFSQAQTKTHGGTPGLGIGLAVVKSLVELHGGTVAAYSAGLGQGTRLRVTLPLAQEQEQEQEQQAAVADAMPGAAGGAGTPVDVLLADDNTDAADLLADFLALQGYTVHTAYDGLAAIELASRIRPQVLVLDIGMPGATGHEIAQWVRQQAWGKDATLVAVTGWGQEVDGDRALRSGFDTRLVKPVNMEQLLLALVNRPAA
ncbi:response regulator [Massilia sp. LXY-6]|uniref:hybrid sensor histidine kinase/response regulator n=1 Tax=Massilia sp. LXY-6 TaxID=3379823 RepID=UPI003EE1C32F